MREQKYITPLLIHQSFNSIACSQYEEACRLPLLKQKFHDIMEKMISMIVPSDFTAISDDDERRRGVY